MTNEESTLALAKEIAAHAENSPMYSTGLVHMTEEKFMRIVLKAKRLLVARASREGSFPDGKLPDDY
jgi:hypothetical protein